MSARGRDALGRPIVAFAALLTLALVLLGLFRGRATDLNDHLTDRRYAYRALAPGGLVGSDLLRTVHHMAPGLPPQLAKDPSAPMDSDLYARGVCTPSGGDLALPVHVGLRVRGEHPTPVGLYFTGPVSRDSFLLLDPDGDLPTRIDSASNSVPSSMAIQPPADFGATHVRDGDQRPELYHDLSVLFSQDSIVVTSASGSRSIPFPGSPELTSVCVAPVVGRTLSVVDQIAVEVSSSGRSPSFSATGRHALRPLFHPLDLETKFADDELSYLVASFVLLALIAALTRGLIGGALGQRRRRSERDPPPPRQSMAGLLTLPAQILVLTFARAAFGLALLPLYVVAVVVVSSALFELRNFTRPAPGVTKKGSPRPALVAVLAALAGAYLGHAVSYRASWLPDLSLAWIVAAAALVALVLWRTGLDRRFPLRATAAVLAQLALYSPLRLAQPALTPITFYALASLPWIVALVWLGASSPTPRRVAERLFTVFAVVVALLLVEIAIRGDHHLDRTTGPTALTASWYNNHVARILEIDLGRGSSAGATSGTVELAEQQVRVAKRDGQLRVVCLGSSSTYGVGASSFEDAYPAQLESALAARTGRDVEVINGGVPGAMLSFLDLYLDRVLLPLQPDLVVLYYGANGDSEAAARDLQRLGRWLGDRTEPPSSTEVWAATQLRWPRPWLVQGLARSTNSRGFVWLVHTAQNLRRTQGIGPSGVSFADDHGSALERVQRGSGSAWSIAERCRESHTPLLLVPEVMREENDRMCSADPGQCIHPYDAVFRHLADRAADDDMHHANLLPVFSSAARGELMFDGVHMRSEGYALLAGSIDAVLADAGWPAEGDD